MTGNESTADPSNSAATPDDSTPVGESAPKELSQGTKDVIDKKLEELKVSKTESGKDQSSKPDTEGSNSSSKNLDEEQS
ncbi:hypothetical protein CBA19CS11_27970 [Caballeronia novacaledonica]|uniref:hypothetical protein n=1 Tax=Caballeronia novacaledonica TaxID=1544861 RepID=UPI001EE3736F|nr:hypothetical protein [Caballeronia novacaledonica]GJH12754.1 hypothetical protein CBA19CS11_27970 [Caballeronia novacaledonica]